VGSTPILFRQTRQEPHDADPRLASQPGARRRGRARGGDDLPSRGGGAHRGAGSRTAPSPIAACNSPTCSTRRWLHIVAPDEADLAARAALCGRFGWSSANESQAPVIARFGELGARLCAARDVDADEPARALAEFEDWYRRERGAPFWLLFEQPIVETPLVDF
jgi:hypothetical protein